MKTFIIVVFIILLSNSMSISQTDLTIDANSDYSVDKYNKRIDSLNTLTNAIKDIVIKGNESSQVKSLLETVNKQKDSLESKRDSLEEANSPNDFRSIFGWNNKKTGTAVGNFWNDTSKKSGVINLGLPVFESRSTLYGEALLDYIGAFRFALSTSITASKLPDSSSTDSAQSSLDNQISSAEAIQNFITSGGNILIKSDFPLLFLANMKGKDEGRNTRSLGVFGSVRLSLNAPAFGGSANITDGLAEIAVEPVFKFQTNQKLIGFTARFRFGYAITSEEKVQTFTNDTGRKTFGYIMTSIILTIKDSFSINFNAPVSWWNSERPLDRTPVSLTIGTSF